VCRRRETRQSFSFIEDLLVVADRQTTMKQSINARTSCVYMYVHVHICTRLHAERHVQCTRLGLSQYNVQIIIFVLLNWRRLITHCHSLMTVKRCSR